MVGIERSWLSVPKPISVRDSQEGNAEGPKNQFVDSSTAQVHGREHSKGQKCHMHNL